MSPPLIQLSRPRFRGPPGVGGGGGSPTLDGDQWSPTKTGDVINDYEWDLPLNTWIEWMDSSLEAQLGSHGSSNYGAAAGYSAPGTGPTAAHFEAYTGAAFDAANGHFYHFGGGHDDGGNNMLTKFECAKGLWSVVIPPTHQSFFPSGYSTSHTGGYSKVYYPSMAVPTRNFNYFPSGETTPGDDKPCACHEYSGMVFVPGINEVLLARFGWFHARIDTGAWRVPGPEIDQANHVGFIRRDGIAFQAHYLASTGLVYLTSEGGQISDNNGYYNIVKYDPVTRTETGAIGWDAGTFQSSSTVDEAGLFWYFGGYGTCKVSTVNLGTSTNVRNATNCTGRRPGWPADNADGANPVQYVSDLDTIFMWVTKGGNEASIGEMLTFDRSTLAFAAHTMAGSSPGTSVYMNNKMRYWPTKKVLVFNTTTTANARVIRLA